MMNKEPTKNHLKNKYVASIAKTPIFFTAPHTKRLVRGGKQYDQKVRMHKRQIYTSFLACDFARGTGKNSFLFWGVTSVINETDIDPNYMLLKMMPNSPFHQSLHTWANLNEGCPILHVDIHGKMNRQKDCEIDVGIRSMEVHWEGDCLIPKIVGFFQKNGNIFEGHKFGKFQCKFNTDPYLHGYWGCNIHTMTEQAIMLGIPSIQLQIPFSVRKRLFRDPQLRGRFHKLLRSLYDDVIVPDFYQKKRRYRVSNEIGKLFVSNINGEKEREQLYEQVARFEAKQQASPNQNKHI